MNVISIFMSLCRLVGWSVKFPKKPGKLQFHCSYRNTSFLLGEGYIEFLFNLVFGNILDQGYSRFSVDVLIIVLDIFYLLSNINRSGKMLTCTGKC